MAVPAEIVNAWALSLSVAIDSAMTASVAITRPEVFVKLTAVFSNDCIFESSDLILLKWNEVRCEKEKAPLSCDNDVEADCELIEVSLFFIKNLMLPKAAWLARIKFRMDEKSRGNDGAVDSIMGISSPHFLLYRLLIFSCEHNTMR
ncbi:MAG: hypothetical protein A2901_03405 [Elusimicrobia bacterium RIFCSPLOWO2_01_FULL_54_10]|nr:MAG: hypothetical protein A2901_03405 [Elusimicrobia bacterium RIFCSPLOWO2_01_FULL_54_10]